MDLWLSKDKEGKPILVFIFDKEESKDGKFPIYNKREDMIREVVESRNVFRVMRLVQSMKLTEEEISYILSVYPEVSKDVDYYQYNNK